MKHTLYAVFVLLSSIVLLDNAYCAVPNPYTGDNEWCNENNTDEQIVHVFWGVTNNDALTNNQWEDVLAFFTKIAQELTFESCIESPIPIFEDTNGGIWGDTWGICVYFSLGFNTPISGAPTVIDTTEKYDQWEGVLNSVAPNGSPDWALGMIDNYGGVYEVNGEVPLAITNQQLKTTLATKTIPT